MHNNSLNPNHEVISPARLAVNFPAAEYRRLLTSRPTRLYCLVTYIGISVNAETCPESLQVERPRPLDRANHYATTLHDLHFLFYSKEKNSLKT